MKYLLSVIIITLLIGACSNPTSYIEDRGVCMVMDTVVTVDTTYVDKTLEPKISTDTTTHRVFDNTNPFCTRHR